MALRDRRGLDLLGRNRKTRPSPRQSLLSIPSIFVGYTLGYTKLANGLVENLASNHQPFLIVPQRDGP